MTDAGVLHKDHYRANMTSLRFKSRSYLLDIIRRETELLASLQKKVRSPLFDQYFALTANLGTHLFYMVFLPTFFWFSNAELGFDFVWGLAIGVFITGVVKDWLCLPRPLSPPVHRISMSGTACLEYGFPSTHSCNALTISLMLLDHFGNNYLPAIAWLVGTIVLGRLYSGMHGMLDVILGGAIGILVYIFRQWTQSSVDQLFLDYSFTAIAATSFLVLAFVITVHPQPVDDCPCFDDTVAFLSVLVGVEVFGRSYYKFGDQQLFSFSLLKGAARFLVGVVLIVAWRIVAKKTMLRVLPPVLRLFYRFGLTLPRQYYTPAAFYDKPRDVPGETVIDSPSQFRQTMSDIRRSRGRSDSVGPQSEHDYYEALQAYSKGEQTMPEFQAVTHPRKRYDVEVITKVVVYAGIPLIVFWGSMPLFTLIHI